MVEQRPSKKQFELLQFIDGFIKGNGYGPSYREIMRALDYKSVSTVAVHVDGLITRGYLRKLDHSARSLEVVSTQSGKSVEKSESTVHEDWLLAKVQTKIDQYHSGPQDILLQEINTLLNALTVLQLHDRRKDMEQKLQTLSAQD